MSTQWLRYVIAVLISIAVTTVIPCEASKGPSYDKYKIVWGDTLSSIGKKFHCSVSSLREINSYDSDRIFAGKTMNVPHKESNKIHKPVKKTVVRESSSAVFEKKEESYREYHPKPIETISAPVTNDKAAVTMEQKPDVSTSGVTPEQARSDSRDVVDWYVGAVDYHSAKNGKANHGSSKWTTLRVRPIQVEAPEGMSIQVGGFGGLSDGSGVANKDYRYSSREGKIGLSAKIYAEHKDFDVDFGWSHLNSEGSWKGKNVKNQTDDSLTASIYGSFYERRDRGEKLFPETDIGLDVRLPFHTKVRQGTKTDNTSVEVSLTQWLYDFGDDSLMFTPGVKLGAGYQGSSGDSFFAKLGAAGKLSSHTKTLGGLSYSYKFQGSGQWLMGIFIHPTGILDALQAAQIREATDADLHPQQQAEATETNNNQGPIKDPDQEKFIYGNFGA